MATSQELILELRAQGFSNAEIGRRLGRDSSLIGQIAKGAKPAVRLVPVPQSGFRLGTMVGRFGALPQFEPLADDELAAWEGEGQA